MRQPGVFPPLVLLSALFAQRYSGNAVGQDGTARSWHLYLLFGVGIPLILLALGWVSCMILEHVNRHVDPEGPREDPPGWATSRWVTYVIDVVFAATAFVALVLALRPAADTWIGINHAYGWLDESPSTGALAFRSALALWVFALLVSLVRRLWRALRPKRTHRVQFAILGALFNAGALAFIVLAVLAYYAMADTDPSSSYQRGKPIQVAARTFDDPAALAKKFSPQLAFDRNEPWLTIAVKTVRDAQPPFFVRDTSAAPTAARLGAPSVVGGVDPESLSCRSPAPCYQVDLTAFGGEDCSRGVTPAGVPGCPSRPAVYARVVRAGADEGAFPSEQLPGPSVGTVIEYWFFYGYDKWEQETPAGLFSQHHDGDWEGAFVAFSPMRKPLWVAYTAHCGGTVMKWSDVRVVAHTTHPYVFVAKGSHANYPTEAPQTPDWLGCERTTHSGRAVAFVDSLANIREQVRPVGKGVRPAVIMVDTKDASLLTAPFWWGTVDKTTVSPPLLSPMTLGTGNGPESPGCKPLWREPIATIYCDGRWDANDVLPDDREGFCSRWRPRGLDCAAA